MKGTGPALTPAPLDYRLAADLASAYLATAAGAGEPLLVVATSAVFAREALTRADGPVTLAAETAPVTRVYRTLAEAGALHPSFPARILPAERLDAAAPSRFPRVLWACPQASTWPHRLRLLESVLAAGALVALVAVNPAAQLAARLRRRRGGVARGWFAGPPSAALSARGYRLERKYVLGGPGAAVWAVMSRVAGAVGRPDLVDRCEIGYRQALADASPRRGGSLAVRIYRREQSP